MSRNLNPNTIRDQTLNWCKNRLYSYEVTDDGGGDDDDDDDSDDGGGNDDDPAQLPSF